MISTLRHTKRLIGQAAQDTSTETVEQFLARGGKITSCPPRPASSVSAYMPSILVDGYELPLGIGGDEYLPNYVRDITTYDNAQRDPLVTDHEGVTAVVRHDVAQQVRPVVSSYLTAQRRASVEDADIMEK